MTTTRTLSEARAFVSKGNPTVNDATFAEWFDLVGGVPRHLVSQQAVNMAVEDQKVVAKRVQFDPIASATEQETNKIVQMLPTDNRLSVKGFDFVSQGACRVWIESQEATTHRKLFEQLRNAKNGDTTRDSLGRYFESWFLSLLRQNPSLSRVSLECKSPKPMLEPWVIKGPLTVVTFPGDEPGGIQATLNPTLHIPMSSKFPVVDAVLTDAKPSIDSTDKVKATLIQVTVAGEHKPKFEPTKALLEALTEANCTPEGLVWVVDISSSLATKQPLESRTLTAYDTIPQWLCRLDEFMCWVRKQGTQAGSAVSFPYLPSRVHAGCTRLLRAIHDKQMEKPTKCCARRHYFLTMSFIISSASTRFS